jgi:DNA-binding IclR family transcriptional regulator
VVVIGYRAFDIGNFGLDGAIMDDRYRVMAVEKALKVLDVFGEQPHHFTLSEVSARSSLSANQAFRLLQTLTAAGWVRHLPDSRYYSLGPRPYGLVRALFHGDELVVASREPLQWAFGQTGETVAIIARDNIGGSICVDVRESDHPLMIAQSIGSRTDYVHAGAASRVLLSTLDEETLDRTLAQHQPLEKVTPWTITDPDEIRADLARVREDGYALSDQEVAVGMYGVAAPIQDRRGNYIAAFTLSAPVLRAGEAERAKHIAVVKSAAQRASINLGYRGFVKSR